MKASLERLNAIAVLLCIALAADAQTTSQEGPSGSRFEAATFFGAMVSGKEIGRGVNAAGGEQLIARLNHGGALGLRVGIHNKLLGLEANVLRTLNPMIVKNEFGVAFPNHGERPAIYSGDALLYPLREAIKEGKVRPYLTGGVGGTWLSADLDNINDRETHNRLTWNAGGGVKVFVGEGPDTFLDFRFTNHRLFGARGVRVVDLRSVTVGVGYRF